MFDDLRIDFAACERMHWHWAGNLTKYMRLRFPCQTASFFTSFVILQQFETITIGERPLLMKAPNF
jgi:hypothetical protein